MEENKQNEEKIQSESKPRNGITEEQRQRRKKMIVYPMLFLVFVGAMYLIFAPSQKEKELKQQGLNTELPMPKEEGIISDKKDAYEKQAQEDKQTDRMHSLDEISKMFGSSEASTSNEDNLKTTEDKSHTNNSGTVTNPSRSISGSKNPYSTIQNSNYACRDINRTLGSFYEKPKEDTEKDELKDKVKELNARLEQSPATNKTSIDDQMALLERSYQLAAKYMPNSRALTPGLSSSITDETPGNSSDLVTNSHNGKVTVSTVRQVKEEIVSALPQAGNDVIPLSQALNTGFHTAVGKESFSNKNTIKACIHNNQTITSGQDVKLRLTEPMKVGSVLVPANTLVVGKSKIQGERLVIAISSLEFQGTIIPVQLSVYDNDGQTGIFIPGSLEQSSIKEIAANMGTGTGSSINLTQQSAGSQLLSDLGKGAIQGTSQYIAKKMQEIKVHLKAGYQVLLYQDKQQ
ncbi:MAG: conjugative transposon protein TraM [Paludibacter sp.]|nr:conjugative transposon protein TraM [Paludibacter sp.]